MNSSSHAVGIDIGGTKIAVAAVHQDGSIVRRVTFATEASAGFSRGLERITQSIENVLASAGWQTTGICGIGLGCAGPVDSVRGLIRNPHTLPGWNGFDIVSPLRERFDTPVFLENDADAALLGESLAGAGRGGDPVAMLTFGTGVGGAVLRQGRIQRGANGQHPEIGHMIVSSSGPECYCGARGCLESLASGTAIAVAGRPFGLPDAQAVFAAARAGNADAQAIVERATHAVAAAAWNLCHTFLPQRIILGGGVMDHHFALFGLIVDRRLRAATQFAPLTVDVAPASLGNDAGIVGAASLAFAQGHAPLSPRRASQPLTQQLAQ
jgi:glucokinase